MKHMIEKVLIQVEDWPGYIICDTKTDMYDHFGYSGIQSSRNGIEE